MAIKVSVLIPVYGVEKYIGRCVESLIAQTYMNCEFIFVDDCSQDRSVEVLNHSISNNNTVKNKIKVIRHERNRGLAASRLTGLKYATGDAVMFVDSDDFLEPNSVECLVEKMEVECSDIVTGGITHIFNPQRTYLELPPDDEKMLFLQKMLERKTFSSVFPRLYKKELFFKIEQPFIEDINYGEDYLMTSRIFYFANKVSVVKRSLYNYIHTNVSSYSYKFKRNNLESLIAIDSIILNFYSSVGNPDLIKSHMVGRLKLKSEQMIMFLRSDNQQNEDYEYVRNSFSRNLTKEFVMRLPLQDIIILFLSKIMPLRVMSIYVRAGYNVKQILKKIKTL